MWPFPKQEIKINRTPRTPLEDRKPNRTITAKYDAAETTHQNGRHWAMSTSESPNTENSLAVRKELRNRSRYEASNNTYCSGMIETYSEWMIGTGPSLQIKSDSIDANQTIEALWLEWSKYINLPFKLRLMQQCKTKDGEGLGILINNSKSELEIQLDLHLIECDRITSQYSSDINNPLNIDGVIINNQGYITHYEILEQHPGENIYFNLGMFKTRRIPAEFVIALNNQKRPEQHRFAPQTASSLELFGISRDFTLATLRAAQLVAENPSVIQTKDLPYNEEEPGERPVVMDEFYLAKSMTTVMPDGYEFKQQKPEQPTSTFAEFDKRIINAEARGLKMPMNIASGNSEGFNYAAGRLDHQSFTGTIRTEQGDLGNNQLDKIFGAFWEELISIPKYRPLKKVLPSITLRKIPFPNHTWMFPGRPHVDPAKEANAFTTLYDKNAITLEQWYAEKGLDWRTAIQQLKVEKEFLKSNNIIVKEMVNE